MYRLQGVERATISPIQEVEKNDNFYIYRTFFWCRDELEMRELPRESSLIHSLMHLAVQVSIDRLNIKYSMHATRH